MVKIKFWLGPVLALTILFVFVIGSAVNYHEVQNELRTKESSLVAKAIAQNLIGEIQNLARTLNILSQVETLNTKQKNELYTIVSKTLVEKYPGFFTVLIL